MIQGNLVNQSNIREQSKPLRVMWLLNHSSARKYEVPMLKKMGFTEIYLPKIVPCSHQYRSASVDFSEDENLTIPKNDLDFLNRIDWYEHPTREAIDIANKYFDIVFFIGVGPIIKCLAKYFKGTIIYRAYGLDKTMSYSKLIDLVTDNQGVRLLKLMGSRFWFGQAYENLKEIEPNFIQFQSVFLPLGMPYYVQAGDWNGSLRSIFFVCPDLGINSYYKNVFDEFVKNFAGFPYIVGGSQFIMSPNNENILGFVSREQHEKNMREMRVMFYHSTEPRHLHYHPLEAIQASMPLIFMAGGMLDNMGGKTLPGRCTTISEARSKIKRIFNDDWEFIQKIRESQTIILESISTQRCEAAWQNSFAKILGEINKPKESRPSIALSQLKKVAVIVPVGYRGGSLRGAKVLAQAIYQGSRQNNESVDVVIAHLDNPEIYTENEFSDLFPGIQLRPYTWRTLDSAEARRAMRYAGYHGWNPDSQSYIAPDDNIRQLLDCDLWLVISDRLPKPLLPLRPCVHMVYDYIQRYDALSSGDDSLFLAAARRAEKILVTTRFTQRDAMQYAGLPLNKVIKVPMLAPIFHHRNKQNAVISSNYFIWTTNAAQHKNHENALKALKWYYEQLEGKLSCYVTGVNTANLFKDPPLRLVGIMDAFKSNDKLQPKVQWLGELCEQKYQQTLAGAAFLWHAAKIDNGTFSVVEAASFNVPALSSDYPAMREIDDQFKLGLSWMESGDPISMAKQLKLMELGYHDQRDRLPSLEQLAEQRVEKLAGDYWRVIRECL